MAIPGVKRVLGNVGDSSFVEHSGGPIYETDDGSFYVEYVEPPQEDFDDPGAIWEVYRVDLDDIEIPDWIDIQDVADCVGMSWMDLAGAFMSPDPVARAFAHEAVASYHGWGELDNYPLHLGRAEVGVRYDDDMYPLMPNVDERQFTASAKPLDIAVLDDQGAASFILEDALPSWATASTETHVYEDQDSYGYWVLTFERGTPAYAHSKGAYVRVAFYEPDEEDARSVLAQTSTPVEPEKKLSLKNSKLDAEFPDLDTVTPEEMLRRMSKWVPG